MEITLGILLFISGYVLGRTNYLYAAFIGENEIGSQTRRQKNKTKNTRSIVEIDESKFVTKIDTTSFIKNHQALGEETISKSDVTDAVSKLKKLKGP